MAAPVGRTFPAHLDSLRDMIDFLSLRARDHGLPEGRISHLELAAEEALVNVISYAYPENSGEIVLEAEPLGDEIHFRIRDRGRPFDSTDSPDPDTTLGMEERSIGGLGLFFIRKFMDRVHYDRQGEENVLTLVMAHGKDPGEEVCA